MKVMGLWWPWRRGRTRGARQRSTCPLPWLGAPWSTLSAPAPCTRPSWHAAVIQRRFMIITRSRTRLMHDPASLLASASAMQLRGTTAVLCGLLPPDRSASKQGSLLQPRKIGCSGDKEQTRFLQLPCGYRKSLLGLGLHDPRTRAPDGLWSQWPSLPASSGKAPRPRSLRSAHTLCVSVSGGWLRSCVWP